MLCNARNKYGCECCSGWGYLPGSKTAERRTIKRRERMAWKLDALAEMLDMGK